MNQYWKVEFLENKYGKNNNPLYWMTQVNWLNYFFI